MARRRNATDPNSAARVEHDMCRKATAQSDWLAHFGRLTHCDHSIHARRGVVPTAGGRVSPDSDTEVGGHHRDLCQQLAGGAEGALADRLVGDLGPRETRWSEPWHVCPWQMIPGDRLMFGTIAFIITRLAPDGRAVTTRCEDGTC